MNQLAKYARNFDMPNGYSVWLNQQLLRGQPPTPSPSGRGWGEGVLL